MFDAKQHAIIKKLLYIAAGILAAWVFLKYLLSWFAPFILAFLTAVIVEPLVRFMSRRFKFKRAFAAFICSVGLFSILIGLTVFAAGRIIYEISSFIKQLPSFISPFLNLFRGAEESLYGYIVAAPPEVQSFFENTLETLREQSARLPSLLYEKLFSFLSSVLGKAPRIIFFAITFGISEFFISAGYPVVRGFIMRQIPLSRQVWFRGLKTGLFDALGTWLRAELTLMAATFLQLTAAFLIMRIDYAVLLAAITAFIDALPFFGIGFVLIPWMLVSMLVGNMRRAVFLLFTFVVITLVRSFLEPKLLGSESGVHPVATLMAIYIGFSISGITGMIICPIILMVIKKLNDTGYIKLWKN